MDKNFIALKSVSGNNRVISANHIVAIDQLHGDWMLRMTDGVQFKLDEEEAEKLFNRLGVNQTMVFPTRQGS